MVDWLAGKRIKGTSTERTASFIPSVGGWVELGRTTLGSTADTISVASLADKRYLMVLNYNINSGVVTPDLRFNADSGSNYSRRKSYSGGAEELVTNQTTTNVGGWDNNSLQVHYIANKSNKEKLNIWHSVEQSTAGAANSPYRLEGVAKWANTTDAINRIDAINSQSGDYASGSEIVVLGWDPADTHTTNFWTELASVSGTGSSTSLSSGTITAKKYLWIQVFTNDLNSFYMRLNSDSGNNYSRRYSVNGSADTTNTGMDKIGISYDGGAGFVNMFMINNSANEKLMISHSNENITAGAGNAPNRVEWVHKWANTLSQVTNITCSQTNNFSTDAIIKVYGSD